MQLIAFKSGDEKLKTLKLGGLLLGVILTQTAVARIVEPASYGFTQKNPLIATLGSPIANNGFTKAKDFDVEVKKRTIPGWSAEKSLHVRFYPATSGQVNARKLLHVVAGLGGNDMGRVTQYLSTLAHKEGYSVVVYPNTLTSNFSIAASRSGLTGAVSRDSVDLYHAMTETLKVINAHGHEFDEHLLTGYSHGALLSAFLNEIDETQKVFQFSRVLIINPAVDLFYGANVLDRFSRNYGFSKIRLITAGLRLKNAVKKYSKIRSTPQSQNNFYRSLNLSDRESSGVIGRLLMSSLPRTILASQDVKDLGILSSDPKKRNGYGFNFETFITRFYSALARVNNEEFDMESFKDANNLYSLGDSISRSQKIFLMHNADDFLLADGDVNWLESKFGDRALIYPRGGHLGNLSYPDNSRAVVSWLNNGEF